jgi:integrase-like protein
MWLRYLKPRCASVLMHDVEPRKIQQLLDAVAHEDELAPQTMQHVKHFIGSVFTFAIAQGHLLRGAVNLLCSAKLKLSQTSTGEPIRFRILL